MVNKDYYLNATGTFYFGWDVLEYLNETKEPLEKFKNELMCLQLKGLEIKASLSLEDCLQGKDDYTVDKEFYNLYCKVVEYYGKDLINIFEKLRLQDTLPRFVFD